MNMGKVVAPAVNKLISWSESAINMLPNILVAILCLILFWFLALVVGWLVQRVVLRLSVYRHVAGLTSRLSRLVVIAVGVLLALDTLSLDRAVASMLAGIGIIGLAFGLAAKNTGGDYLAGFIIHFTHPYRMGHLIQSGSFMGYVESFGLRSTKIRTQQGQRVTIPNHKIMESELINYTITGERRVDIECGMPQDADLEKIEDVAVKAVESLKIRNPEREVELFYSEIADSSINFTIRFWTEPDQITYLTARSQAIKAIQQAFKSNGVKMASPVRILDFSAEKEGSLRAQLKNIDWVSGSQNAKRRVQTEEGQKEERPEKKKNAE